MTDAQKIVMHLCWQAEKRGRDEAWITRDSMLDGKTVPVYAGMKLVWAALTIPKGVLEWSDDEQQFRLSEIALSSIRRRRAKRLEAVR